MYVNPEPMQVCIWRRKRQQRTAANKALCKNEYIPKASERDVFVFLNQITPPMNVVVDLEMAVARPISCISGRL